MPKRIVAVALLTAEELASLGATFSRAFPVAPMPSFDNLLAEIDHADRRFKKEQAEARE